MKKTITGKIVSDKMAKTALVEVTLWKIHPILKKRYKITRRYMADNPNNEYKIDELVRIEETRPLSRHKSWKIIKKISAKELLEK